MGTLPAPAPSDSGAGALLLTAVTSGAAEARCRSLLRTALGEVRPSAAPPGVAGEGAARAATTAAATLETKYYTATLRVRTTVVAARGHTGATGDAANVQAASADSAADDAEEHSDAEALVLVYDAREEASFSQALAQWVEGAGAGAAEVADARLLVGVGATRAHLDADGSDGASSSRAVAQWCLQRGFEHVLVADDAALDAALWDERGEGSRRVRDALAATAWSTIRRKGEVGDNEQQQQQEGDEVHSEVAADGLATRGEDTAKRLSEAISALEGALSEENGSDDDGAAAAEELERLMEAVSKARERSSGIGDAARRENAAKIAMQMAAAFGLDDE